MELICLGSSSSGNCYLLNAKDETLIVECGIHSTEAKKALLFDISRISGCVVSHQHNDHAKFIEHYMRLGIPVLATAGTFESKNITNRAFAIETKHNKGYKFGGFSVYALELIHDVPCYGFIISHPEMGKTLFATDTMMVGRRTAEGEFSKYRLPQGLNHIMIEANYSDADLIRTADKERLMYTHMELGTTAEFVKSCNLDSVNEIVLLHLSADNSNLTHFQTEIEEVSGKPVYIARKGLKIDFSKEPF